MKGELDQTTYSLQRIRNRLSSLPAVQIKHTVV